MRKIRSKRQNSLSAKEGCGKTKWKKYLDGVKYNALELV
jgi:hypothetical protein